MKFSLVFILFLLSCCEESFSQIYFSDARDMAMANASVASMPTDGISKNCAFIPPERKSLLCMNVINKYQIKDFSPAFLTFIKTFNDHTSVLLGIGKTGNNNFSEQTAETGIAKKLADKFTAGIKIEYHQWTLNDGTYLNSHAFIPSLSLLSTPIRHLTLGAIIRNPVRSRMNAIEKNKLPAGIDAGLAVTISPKIIIAGSFRQQNNIPLSTQFGMEYIVHPLIVFRCGWQTIPVSQSFGFGINLNRMKMDLGMQTHPLLGNSYCIALNFKI